MVGGLLSSTCGKRRIMLVRGRFKRVNVSNKFLGRTKVRVHRVGSKYVYYSLIKSFKGSLRRIMSACRPSHVLVRPSKIKGLSSMVGTMRSIRNRVSTRLGDFAAIMSMAGYGVCHGGFKRFFDGRVRCTNTIVLDHASGTGPRGVRRDITLLERLGRGTPVVAAPVRRLPNRGVLRAVRSDGSLRRRLLTRMTRRTRRRSRRRRRRRRYSRRRRRRSRRRRSRRRRRRSRRRYSRRRRRRRSRRRYSRRRRRRRSRRRRRRRRRSKRYDYNYKRRRRRSRRNRRRTSRMFAD